MLVTARPLLPLPRRRFPGLHAGPLSRRRTYLDNACLTPPAAEVVEAVREYYEAPPGCPLRSNSGRSDAVEQRIRGADSGIASALVITGYDGRAVAACVNDLCDDGGLPSRGGTELHATTYSGSYCLARTEIVVSSDPPEESR